MIRTISPQGKGAKKEFKKVCRGDYGCAVARDEYSAIQEVWDNPMKKIWDFRFPHDFDPI